MKLRLNEDRRDWLKTNAALAVLATVLAWHGHGRGWWSLPGGTAALPGALLMSAALASRTWARLAYRGTLRAGFLLGRVSCWLLLGLIFVLVVVPTGWLLRWRGQDPLCRHDLEAESWWEQPSGSSERQHRF